MEFHQLTDRLIARAAEYAYKYLRNVDINTNKGADEKSDAFNIIDGVIRDFSAGDDIPALTTVSGLKKVASRLLENSVSQRFVYGLRTYTFTGITRSDLDMFINEYAFAASVGLRPPMETQGGPRNKIDYKETPENDVSIREIADLLLTNNWIVPLMLLGGNMLFYIDEMEAETE